MTTNPNYYYAPSTIKNLLDKSIYSVTDVINWYTKSLDVDFTRIRKIIVDTLIKFILLMSTDKSINSSLPKYISNFPYFTGFPACALAKRYVFSLIFALMR